jgi:hypothetical protein
VAALLCTTGCATKPKPSPTRTLEPRFLGTVALVNEKLGFALLDVGTLYLPAEGVALKTFSPTGAETGVLAVSKERRPPFVVADVVKGTPQKGDRVFE